ncbi:MAG: hypothetical protein KIC78_06960 [Prevotella sp.]|uniref:DUF3226 domain-containing protein n=1 Tax=Prevotella sp. TaxID=59823 RepID=UPI0025811F07|nr:DUF3226 domain-containing protein [Prevotella sp.]MBS5875897.1 hypothetical protein [Prevotella sp.]
MTKIFIEARNKNTAEYHFIKAILNIFFPERDVDFIFMDGIGNLFKEAIVNQISLAQENGEQVIVLADADTIAKGYGYAKRKAEIDNGMAAHALSFSYFLYPDNQNDGDVEVLMEKAARHDLHSKFFDCFEDYEKCVSGVKDESGEQKYNVPNLRGKLHTYMSAQKLPGKLRKRFGLGDWLFYNKDYWNLDVDALQPLKDFLDENIK